MAAHRLCIAVASISCLIGVVPATFVAADTLVLRTGARIVGVATVSIENGRKSFRVQTENGIEVSLPGTEVAEHIREQGGLAEYERVAPTFGDTIEEQWAIAEWCRERKLDRQRQIHLRRVIELDPANAGAWRALGYMELEGKWQTRDEVFENRGFVFYQGRWRMPQEVDLLEEQRRIESIERDWYAKLKLWRGQLGGDHDAEVVAKIKAINDPHALKAIADHLRRERWALVRILYLDALAGIRDRRAVELIVGLALNDPDIEVFHAAADKLVSLNWPGLAKALAPSLQSASNERVNRGAYLLGRLDDPIIVPALINALTTTHYSIRPGSGRTTATLVKGPGNAASNKMPTIGLGGTGSNGFSVGDKPQVTAYRISNQEVLRALVQLSDGQSFGFDQRAWTNWWALAANRSMPSAEPLR